MFRYHTFTPAHPYPFPLRQQAEPMRTVRPSTWLPWFSLSTALFIIHGIEEFFGGFSRDPVWRWFASWAMPDVHTAAGFLLFHFVFWGLLIGLLAVARRRPVPFNLMTAMSLVMVLEIYHIGVAIANHAYAAGMLSSVFLAGMAIWAWIELLVSAHHYREGVNTYEPCERF